MSVVASCICARAKSSGPCQCSDPPCVRRPACGLSASVQSVRRAEHRMCGRSVRRVCHACARRRAQPDVRRTLCPRTAGGALLSLFRRACVQAVALDIAKYSSAKMLRNLHRLRGFRTTLAQSRTVVPSAIAMFGSIDDIAGRLVVKRAHSLFRNVAGCTLFAYHRVRRGSATLGPPRSQRSLLGEGGGGAGRGGGEEGRRGAGESGGVAAAGGRAPGHSSSVVWWPSQRKRGALSK